MSCRVTVGLSAVLSVLLLLVIELFTGVFGLGLKGIGRFELNFAEGLLGPPCCLAMYY